MAGRKTTSKKCKSTPSVSTVTNSEDEVSIRLQQIRRELEPLKIPVNSEEKTCSNCIVSLGKNMFVSAGEFQHRLLIHIRYWNDNKPTKQGITLTPQRWLELFKVLDDVTDSVNNVKEGKHVYYTYHLGGNWYVTVDSSYPCVNIRRFWMPPEASSICATKNGITLSFTQYEELKTAFTLVESCYPELKELQPCYMGLDHQNLLGALECSECSPNGY